MLNIANENKVMGDYLKPEGQLRSLCDLLNDVHQPEMRDAFRALVSRWLEVGDLKRMLADAPPLYDDLANAWSPYFLANGKGAVWSATPIPKEAIPRMPGQWAIRHFALLVLNPLCKHLRGPCPRCGDYYVKKRETKVYCRQSCGNAASATHRAAIVAKAEREALLKVAAELWPEWTEWKHPNRSVWIAEQLNRRRIRFTVILKRKKKSSLKARRITPKWVTRNRVGIAARNRTGKKDGTHYE